MNVFSIRHLVASAVLGATIIGSMVSSPALASGPAENTEQCNTVHMGPVRQHFRWKEPDTIRVEIMKPSLFKVTLTKDGKTGVYAYDGCTGQSRKIR
jgi:hypothetical protein